MRLALVLFIVLGGSCVAWDVYETTVNNAWAAKLERISR